MNTDIRLSIDFWDHPKTVKLERRLGLEAVKSLQILWLWAAVNRADGVLSGMDCEDIEIAARWPGSAGALVDELVVLRWLREVGGVYTLYAWKERNSWAAQAVSRSDKARLSRMAKTHPDLYEQLAEREVKGITKEQYAALTSRQQTVNESLTTVEVTDDGPLTPAPAPAPSPAPYAQEGGDDAPPAKSKSDRINEQANEVLAYLNEKTGKRFKVTGLIPARLRDGATVDECKQVIDIKVADKGFSRKYLDHTTPFRPDNFDKYLNQGTAHGAPADGGLTYDDDTATHDQEWADPGRNRWAQQPAGDNGGVPEARQV